MNQPLKVDPDLDFIRSVRRLGGDTLKKCYQCATCSCVCELSPDDQPFPRKEMLWAQWGMKDRLLADPDVWLCYQCADCSVHCPRGAAPGDVLNAVRSAVFENFAFPRFMGKAVNSPKGLPFLALFAAAVIFVIMMISGPATGEWGLNAPLPEQYEDGSYEGGFFGNFLKHKYVDATFILGNLLIFTCLAISLSRFWKAMKRAYGNSQGPTFIQCAIETMKEIATHSAFRNCKTNKSRYIAHLFVFYGFVGAFVTTGFAFLLILLGQDPPIPLWHPVKILGNISFFLLVVGTLILIVRRLTDKENKVGTGGYPNTLFLVVLFIVALFGGLTQFGRLSGVIPLANLFYFVHMVSVFFLLWYAPYSKLAHVFYRTLAMVFAKTINRSHAKKAA